MNGLAKVFSLKRDFLFQMDLEDCFGKFSIYSPLTNNQRQGIADIVPLVSTDGWRL